MAAVRIHHDISSAMGDGRPIVALETAVLTHGLPRTPMNCMPECRPAGWQATSPINLEAIRAMQRAVRAEASVPAAIGIMDGSVCIGMDDDSLAKLSQDTSALKATARDLAPLVARQVSAGATISATLAACALTDAGTYDGDPASGAQRKASLPGIRVFATGGIGGVHRGWSTLADVSADLVALSRTPLCVVCSGPKAVLDVPATMEALESLSVLVLGYQTDVLPEFYSAGHSRLRLAHRAESPAEIAEICRVHWNELGGLSAVLVCQPPPSAHAMQHDEMDRLIDRATGEAAQQGIQGSMLTPFLLDRVAALSGGRSLESNIGLLIENAHLAGRIAAALGRGWMGISP